MDQQFTDYGEQDRLHQRLYNMKQGGCPLFLFHQDFNNILLRIDPRLQEKNLLFVYTHAIDPKVALQIAHLKSVTLNDAMAAAAETSQFF
jgi:hypothetical protein